MSGDQSSEKREVILKSIGIIHTPFSSRSQAPIQGGFAPENEGEVELFDEFAEGLKDIEGFSHIILIYCFHLSPDFNLVVKPFLDSQPRGVFSTRAPWRPNPIGLTIVRLSRREGGLLHVKGVDMVDGTPLLDIKPHVPPFTYEEELRLGWLEGKLKGKKDV
ncbi:MAG: tRNA (N6-threonylcarbamoyladenosine(37)-N6)-methyltransferase TrmO [Actinomycetota bacterium]|nr:tRNA (N6-threonylcarbamoyladenosine(37)-N6)-methyltransferase TrmO [Actinomycetota bacterium]